MKVSLFGRQTPSEGVSLLVVKDRPSTQAQAQEKEVQVQRWWILECNALTGERILVVPDRKDAKASKAAFPGLVRYFGPEVEELHAVGAASVLAGHPQEEMDAFLRGVHRLKKEFAAWVIPGSGGLTTAQVEAKGVES